MEARVKPGHDACRRRGSLCLALRELEATSGLGAAVLLSLYGARVAREEAALLQHRAELKLEAGAENALSARPDHDPNVSDEPLDTELPIS